MNNPIWQSASEIEDRATALRKLVDRAELDPDPDLFYRIRGLLSDVGNEAGFIVEQTKEPKTTPTEPTVISASRQPVGATETILNPV